MPLAYFASLRTLPGLRWIIVAALTCGLSGQGPPLEVKLHGHALLPLRFEANDTLSGAWRVIGAELRENLTATWGVLTIQNVSGRPVEEPRFYLEYLDSGGRLCLTLVFVGEANQEKNDRSFAAGDVRELVSLAAGMGPAVEPVRVRVHFISQKGVGESREVAAGERIIHAPVAVASPSAESMELNLDWSQAKLPAMDLILAKVATDAQGRAEKVQILRSSNARAQAWFERLASARGSFVPASVGFVNAAGTGLVLVRAVDEIGEIDPAALLPRKSPWVRAYVRQIPDNEVPSVTSLIFAHSSRSISIGPDHQAGRTPDLNRYQLVSAGSEWSSNIFKWVPNRQADGTIRTVRTWHSTKELTQ